MSDAERQSPRTAIRNWLQITDVKSTTRPADPSPEQQNIERTSRHLSRRNHTTRYPSKTRDQHDNEVGRKRQRRKNSGSQQKRVADTVLLVNAHQAQSQIHSRENAAVISNGLGLAERLGLHAPFRTFKDHSDNDILDFQRQSRKRRRSRSSTSSYLEPAAANDFSENDRERPCHSTILRTASPRPTLGDRDKSKSPTTSQGSKTMLPPPEKLPNSYERRPRHKTRQDRYELKDNNRDDEKTNQTTKKARREKRQKKHKRKEKSGAALMLDFTAQNVAHDRLTMKPAKTLGLFGKGRASSPVRRKGLPDLAFSEMTFLTSRREKPKDSLEDLSNRPTTKKKHRKSTKAADTEAEISRFFTSAKPTKLDVTSSHRQRYRQDRRQSRNYESPQALVDLPDQPFLGFGSCGPNTSTSPAKLSINTSTKSLRRSNSRSPTRSMSYLTWSQSGGHSYASPPPDRRHGVEPLTSSKLFNRKRTSPASHKGQHPVPPVSPPRMQTTSSRTQDAGSRLSPKHGTANKAPGQSSESPLTTSERLRSREKGQNHGDTEIIQLDAAKIPKDIEDSVPDNTHPAEAAAHDGPESALPPRKQASCQSLGHEPLCEPQAHDVLPLSDQIIISPHRHPLDDILEALRDCNTNVAGSNPGSRATSSHRNFRTSEEARIPGRTQENTPMFARALVHNSPAPEAPASASNSASNPRIASLQQASAYDGPRAKTTSSRRSPISTNRPNLRYTKGYPAIPTQIRMDPSIAWNDYDGLHERQQEQVNYTSESSRELVQPYTAVRDDLSGPSRETDHAAAPDKYAQKFHPMEDGDQFDDHRPYWHEMVQGYNDNSSYQDIRHGKWGDQFGDHGACYNSGASLFDESRDCSSDRTTAGGNVKNYQQREMDADREQSFSQRADQHEIEHQLFTTNIPETCSSRRLPQIFGRDYGLERGTADGRVHDIDPTLSGFWTPHKLY